jgi:hypothetical protein
MSYGFSGTLDLLIKLLKIPVLALGAVLLYRLDRFIASGLHSAEMIENTAENVERSSQTICDLAGLVRMIPGVSKERQGDKDE